MTADGLNVAECSCGPSYVGFGKRSKCEGVAEHDGYIDFTFSGGEWRNDAVPCLNDLYMAVTENSGRKHAVTVKINVRS